MVRALLIRRISASFKSLIPSDSLNMIDVEPVWFLSTPPILVGSSFPLAAPSTLNFMTSYSSGTQLSTDLTFLLYPLLMHPSHDRRSVGLRPVNSVPKRIHTQSLHFAIWKMSLKSVCLRRFLSFFLSIVHRTKAWIVFHAIFILGVSLDRKHEPTDPTQVLSKTQRTSKRLAKFVHILRATRQTYKKMI